MKKNYNLRALAALAIYQVIEKGKSLSTVLPALKKNLSLKDSALLSELCFGILRTLPEQEFFIQKLMKKILIHKNRILHYLLITGTYQLTHTRIPPHAAVDETVKSATVLKKTGFKKLINAILREFQRTQSSLIDAFSQSDNTSLHPVWLNKRLQSAYPKQWQHIVAANNQKPPMWLRVNTLHHDAASYAALLLEHNIHARCDDTLPAAICLAKPMPTSMLPGFDKGWVTVQDRSAQQAAYLLAPQDNDLILDLCAAPGGKTTHILEQAPHANVIAVDIDPDRVKHINDNLNRLGLKATVKVGDGRQPKTWIKKGTQFDRILLDAPCSGTGVIRRHPDIKWLRRDSDIEVLAKLQREIMTAIWPYLKPGGTLVYATCSLLPEENHLQIACFLNKNVDASLKHAIIQYIPNQLGGDGFFYAVLNKKK